MPALPPWTLDECEKCAAPVRLVEMGDSTQEVCMKPAPLSDRRADLVTVTMDAKLIGRVLEKDERPRPDELLWVRHYAVCSEVERTEQLSLPTEE